MTLAASSQEVHTPEDLITGEKKLVTGPVMVLSGTSPARLSVMGIVTASGKAVLSAAAANDGSQVPDHILVHAVDATSADTKGPAYLEGCFNPELLVYGAGHTEDTVAPSLRDKGIYLRKPG